MKWEDISKTVGKLAPIVGTMLGGPAGAIVGQGISIALGVDDKPDAVALALKNDPDALVKIKQYQIDHKYDLEKLHLKAAQQQLDADSKDLDTINGTIRAEMNQQDNYTKRWRPTMGYAVTFTWLITWIAVVYTIIFNITNAQAVIVALTQTTTLWGVALAVIGVSAWRRTTDKQIMAGIAASPGSTMKKLVSTIKPAIEEKY